jgi:hypothetical protein
VEINSHSLFSRWFSEVSIQSFGWNLSLFSNIYFRCYQEEYGFSELALTILNIVFFFNLIKSGKLVMRMFKRIQELVADPEAFVCVLIDEVESLTAARQAAMSGTEPSDAIRVVNAVLTQIDAIKRWDISLSFFLPFFFLSKRSYR